MGSIQGGLGRKYLYSKSGQLWVATPADPTTEFTHQTAFLATTPALLIRKSGGTKRTILDKLRISQTGGAAGAEITVAIMLDNIDRLSGATGTLIPASNPSMKQDETPEFTVRANPTAVAASADVRTIFTASATATVGETAELDLESVPQIQETGSILIYMFAAATGPTIKPALTIIEEPF